MGEPEQLGVVEGEAGAELRSCAISNQEELNRKFSSNRRDDIGPSWLAWDRRIALGRGRRVSAVTAASSQRYQQSQAAKCRLHDLFSLFEALTRENRTMQFRRRVAILPTLVRCRARARSQTSAIASSKTMKSATQIAFTIARASLI